MSRRVIYLHTVMSVAAQFAELSRVLLPPGTETWHIVDEMLARLAVSQGRLSPFLYRRVAEHAAAAEAAGADAFQITCSSLSPCAPIVAAQVGVPVLAVDEEMVELALGFGARVGIAGTAKTALDPLVSQVRDRAAALGVAVEVQPVLAEAAYAGLVSGDLALHDRIVSTALEQLRGCADVVLLAQASMGRVADSLPARPGAAPILASPPLALARLSRVLSNGPRSRQEHA
jgi:Asp/Glu/hydantoin racemase